jgi:hypothetical protein
MLSEILLSDFNQNSDCVHRRLVKIPNININAHCILESSFMRTDLTKLMSLFSVSDGTRLKRFEFFPHAIFMYCV